MPRPRLWALCCAVLLLFGARAGIAQDYPTRPVTIVVAFAAGSGSDILARILAEELRATLKQPFIVENKPGANGQIASEFVARARPDGYTLLMGASSTHSINPHVYRSLPYDPVKDFTPVVRLCDFPFLLVVDPKLPIRTPQDLVAYARANRGKLSYAYPSRPGQVAAASLNALLDLDMNPVGYASSPPAMQDVAAGRDVFMVVDFASSQGLVKANKLRAIAVMADQPTSLAPDLPPLGPALGIPGYDLRAWTGLLGPARLPQAVVDKLGAASIAMLARPEMAQRLSVAGMEPTPMLSTAYAAFLKEQYDFWGAKVKAAGIEPE